MMRLLMITAVALMLLGVGGNTVSAGDCGCQAKCPQCDHICQLNVETEKVKHSCWNVECVPICIPRVTFPWQKCCEPKCAKLKYVRVLKKHEWECEHCKYSWSAVCGGCTDGGCAAGDGSCGNGSCKAATGTVEVHSDDLQPPAVPSARRYPPLRHGDHAAPSVSVKPVSFGDAIRWISPPEKK